MLSLTHYEALFLAEFACSTCVCAGFPRVLQLPQSKDYMVIAVEFINNGESFVID